MSRTRSYCFTINNYTDDDIQCVKKLMEISSYCIVGKEVGEQGTPHLQGYVYFPEAKTFTSVKKKLPRAHIEVCKGSPLDNYKYCSKEEILFEKGDLPKQGNRTDIDSVRTQLKEGANMRTIIDVAKSYQSVRIGEIWLKYNEKGKDWKPEVRWYYGSTGSGKTKSATEWLGEDIFKPLSFKWWEGYDGHENVLLDEIRGDFCKYHEMLKLLDYYSYRVECKGGSRQLLAKKIAITSPFHPKRLWQTVEDKEQLLRRIDEIILCGCECECESECESEC